MKSQSINLSFDTAAVSRATTTGDRMKYWKATYKSADRGARVQQLLDHLLPPKKTPAYCRCNKAYNDLVKSGQRKGRRWGMLSHTMP